MFVVTKNIILCGIIYFNDPVNEDLQQTILQPI